MKKTMIICVCGLLLAVAGCKHHGGNEPEDPQSFAGNASRPSWTAPTDYDYSSSMTAIVKIDLAAQYPDQAADFVIDSNDLLAAFSDNECLGVAIVANDSYRSQTQQEGLFFLYICAPTNGENITLRYYSSALKNIFTAEPFTFVNDTQLGSIAEPYMPQLVLEK